MITLIAAMTPGRVIGKDGRLPFHCRADMRHFRAITMGHPIIMGRKTYESLHNRPLKYRINIVLSHRPQVVNDGSYWFDDQEEALDFAKIMGQEAVFVIGGALIYKLFLPQANKILLTEVDSDAKGDTFFPEIGTNWKLIKSTPDDGCIFHAYERS